MISETDVRMEQNMKDFFAIYYTLLAGIDSEETVSAAISGGGWSAAETETAFGIAMTVEEDTAPRMLQGDMTGIPLRELAQASKSWNLREASFGMAAVNAYYNTPERLESLGAYEPVENYCTAGLDLRGQRIGVVGHLKLTPEVRSSAAQIWTLERDPKPGDYPDSACDALLPRCDTVIITACTLANKTLPHLLELCRDAYMILVGPSCPMCPELLEHGIDRLAGLVVTDRAGMTAQINSARRATPYPMGKPFLLKKN